MKYSHFLVFVLIFFGLSSCFIADDAFGEPKAPKLSLKQKTQMAITSYVKDNSQGFSYYKYGFSDLIIHKPEKMMLLDSLKFERKNRNLDQVKLEEKISTLEKEVQNQNLRYTIEMDHVYSLTNKKTGYIELYESRFLLADSLEVNDVTLLMNISMDDDQESIFADYFYETVIFYSGDYAESRSLSKAFYSFFKKRQEELVVVKDKSEFLEHTLWLCQEVKGLGIFNQSKVLEKMAKNRLYISNDVYKYQPIEFSQLYQKNEAENLKSYYFFHKFSHLNGSGEDEISVVSISFSPYYEITEILQVEKPFKQYFNE